MFQTSKPKYFEQKILVFFNNYELCIMNYELI